MAQINVRFPAGNPSISMKFLKSDGLTTAKTYDIGNKKDTKTDAMTTWAPATMPVSVPAKAAGA